jgi:hypothetical protein
LFKSHETLPTLAARLDSNGVLSIFQASLRYRIQTLAA